MSAVDPTHALRQQLRGATDEARALAATNRRLTGRVASLERQLGEAGALSDDELLAELPRRMKRALESAQEVAEELVARAQRREQAIRQRTDQRAAAILAQADAEATAALRRAAGEAVATINQARHRAEAIVRAAQLEHEQVLSDLREQSHALEERVAQLQSQHSRLVQAYNFVERSLGEARGALRSAVDVVGPSRTDRDPRNGTPRPRPHAVPLYAVDDGDVDRYDGPSPVSGTA